MHIYICVWREKRQRDAGKMEGGDFRGPREVGRQPGSGMNVLIYVRTINNHHKYFGRHISRLVCQHWSPPFAIPCVFNHAEKRRRRRDPAPARLVNPGGFPNASFRLIKIITWGPFI